MCAMIPMFRMRSSGIWRATAILQEVCARSRGRAVGRDEGLPEKDLSSQRRKRGFVTALERCVKQTLAQALTGGEPGLKREASDPYLGGRPCGDTGFLH